MITKTKDLQQKSKNERAIRKAAKKHQKDMLFLEKEKRNELRRAKRRRRFRILGMSIGFVIFVGVSAICILVYKAYPEYEKLSESVYDDLAAIDDNTFTRAGNTEIYDNKGNIIGKLGNEKYEYVPITDISPYITKGYVAQEDKNFYTHPGVDFKALARAGFALIKNKGKITQGGSTITQQVIKNNILSQEQTYVRKVLEIMLAFKIERRFDKAQIMEFYCNSNYYGNGCYGIESACQYYFGKSAKEVTLAEAAILIGTSNSPNNYNPVASYELAMKKKAEVLENMLSIGLITNEDYKNALSERPDILQKTENTVSESYMITYALHCATLEQMKKDGFEFKYLFESSEEYESYKMSYTTAYSETYQEIRESGYKIYTSFDMKIQEKLQHEVDDNLSDFGEKTEDGIYEMQGAAVCIDNHTQMIVAIVGGRNEEGSFNRGYQAQRQPGSAIKPLLDFGPAMEEGLVTPATVMYDEEIDYDGYSPKNSNNKYRGEVTVRESLARSINTIAVQLFDQVGKENALSYLGKMHFSSLVYADSTVLTVALGGFTKGVTVVDMAKGYATLANSGRYSTNNCLIKIEDYTGKAIYSCENVEEQVFCADTAFILSDMMQGVRRETFGTARKMPDTEQIYAVKTGTANDNKDAWFCGYSNYYTTAVWVGCDTPREVENLKGNTYPMDIWYSFMESIHKKKKPSEFEVPHTVMLQKTEKKESQTDDKEDSSRDTNEIEVEYQTNIYDSRPDDYDYISTMIRDNAKRNEEDLKQEALRNRANRIVTKFESIQILTLEDAVSYKEDYEACVDELMEIDDEAIREEYLSRIAARYELLEKSVVETWGSVEEAEQKYALLINDADNQIEAQESVEAAYKKFEEKETLIVQWYIDELNKRELYTDSVAKMISDCEEELKRCVSFSNYQDLYSGFLNAKWYAQALPSCTLSTEDMENTELPTENMYSD